MEVQIKSSESDFDDDTALESTDNHDFAKRMNQDFDTRKMYEDYMLKILNDYSRQVLKNPPGHEEFKSRYAKPESLSHLKRTLFIDLDDTLVKVSLFPLGTEF